jgi:hypothetical protein
LQARLTQNFYVPQVSLNAGEFVFLVIDNDGDWYADSTAVEFAVWPFQSAVYLSVQTVTYSDITVVGKADHTYRVEYIDALATSNQWLLLTNLTLVGASQTFRDGNPSLRGHRFYRVIEAP